MNTFGLGLILSFTDNASSGINSVTQSFLTMSDSIEQGAEKSQNSLTDLYLAMNALNTVGNNFINLGTGILSTYSAFANTVSTIGSDFENTRMTLAALYKDSELAEEKLQWMIDFAATTPFDVQSLKSALVGLKAIGIEADQMVTSVSGYSQTLMGYVGDLAALRPDVPMERLVYSIRNALGGNVRSLAMTLDVDVESILGREFGGDPAQDIADLVSNLGAEGLMASLEGTWGQMISNMDDQWTKFVLAVSDAGMFDMLKNTLSTLYTAITSLTDEQLQTAAETVTNAFARLWEPVDAITTAISELIPKIIEFAEENPELTETLVTMTAAFAGVSIVIGLVLKAAGNLGMTFIGLQSLFTNLPIVIGKVTAAISGISLPIFTVIAAVAALYSAWQTNFLGIRDIVTTAVEEIGTTLGLLFNALFDNTLSYEDWQKAKDLGILPFIESILQLKYDIGLFVEGFKEGFAAIFNILSVADETIRSLGIYDFFAAIGEFIGIFTSDEAEEVWKFFGRIAGAVVSVLAVLKVVTTVLGVVFKIGSTVFGVITKIIPLLKVVGVTLAGIFSSPAILVAAAVAAVASVIGIFVKFKDEIIQHFKDTVSRWGEEWNNMINNIKNAFSNLVDSLMGIFEPFFIWIDEHFGWIADGIESFTSGLSNFWGTPEVPSDATVVDVWPNGKPQGLDTGGYVKSQGMALLHPNEIVVNDDLTQQLRNFLNDYRGEDNPRTPTGGSSSSVQQDNRVVFESGSIVLQVENTNDANLEEIADRLMRIIARKQQLKNMAVRRR